MLACPLMRLRDIYRSISLALLLTACGTDPVNIAPDGGVSQGTDAQIQQMDGSVNDGPRVEIGTGRDTYAALGNEAHALIVGPQGGGRYEGVHLIAAVRLHKLDPKELKLITVLVLDENRQQVADISRDPKRSPFVPNSEGGMDLLNLNPRLLDCCEVAGKMVFLRTEVQADGGQMYESEKQIQLTACPAEGPNLCP